MLSKEQIREVYGLVTSKYVRYYDLQIELVHQLVKKVEYQLAQNPEMNFRDALQEAYSSYGIFGFSKIVMKKESLIGRQSMHLWIREFFHWFSFPRLLSMAFLFFILWTVCGLFSISFAAVAFITFCTVQGIILHLNGKRAVLHNRSPLLMLVPFKISFFQVGYFVGFVPFYVFLILTNFNLIENGWAWIAVHTWVVALWMTVSLIFIVSHLAVYKRVLEQAKEKYPGFFKS